MIFLQSAEISFYFMIQCSRYIIQVIIVIFAMESFGAEFKWTRKIANKLLVHYSGGNTK